MCDVSMKLKLLSASQFHYAEHEKILWARNKC